MVQCVPTRKGHQILYKGFTYVFKSKLQCGAEQWICSSRQRTGTETTFPEWVSIYFTAVSDREAMKCNLCEVEIDVAAKSSTLVQHMKEQHKDIYDLHKENPKATIGFRVEFLQMKDGEVSAENVHSVTLGEECETTTDETVAEITTETVPESDVINMQYVMMGPKKKSISKDPVQRKRSWIWKYFERLSNIVYRCTLCNVVLSTKGSNTNNLNRHMRTKHPDTFKAERFGEALKNDSVTLEVSGEGTPYVIKEEAFSNETSAQKGRRSWVWSYFDYVSQTQAQCKLCHRLINHGGNATGNMNRHLKAIHHKTVMDCATEAELVWVWKVFLRETTHFLCKICQQKISKKSNSQDMAAILTHLKKEHGVVSGDQIITGSECDLE